jgi:nitrite reductase/ring-hydroxylating ferredoxin subunit
VKVAETFEVPVGKMKMVKLSGEEVLIANVDGNYYAIGNKCTHLGGDLSRGTLDGKIVTCPKCKNGAKFDVTTGKAVSGSKVLFIRLKVKDQPTFKVKVEEKNISLNSK